MVFLKTGKKLTPDYLFSLSNTVMLFIRTIKIDTVAMYVLGVFYNKTDALKYLNHAREMGFNKAYISNQYELDNESKKNLTSAEKKAVLSKIDHGIFTIQLKASKNPLDISRSFSGIVG